MRSYNRISIAFLCISILFSARLAHAGEIQLNACQFVNSSGTQSTTSYKIITSAGMPFAGRIQGTNYTVKSGGTYLFYRPAPPQGLSAVGGDAAVDLSWSANTALDLAGYNIYRSTASGSAYAKINTSLITTTTYHDTGLTNGTTYYYVVTAVDKANNESSFSNEASASLYNIPSESESNNTYASANPINLNSPIKGTINPAGDWDLFKVNISTPGMLTISLTNVPSNINAAIILIDPNHLFWDSRYMDAYVINGNTITMQKQVTLTGNYYIEIYSTTSSSSTLPYKLEVSLSLVWSHASPDFFSPNGDGQKDSTTIKAAFGTQANWTLDIKDASGAIKRTFTGTGSGIRQTWDGKDVAGNVVADGAYTYIIDALDLATGLTIARMQGYISVDNTPPVASIAEPGSGAILTGTVAIKGIADDANFLSARLYSISPTNNWYTIEYIYAKVGPPAGVLTEWDTTQSFNNSYILRLEVYDKAGNKRVIENPVTLYNNVSMVYARPNYFSPNEDGAGDFTIIYASLALNYNWRINIKNSSGAIKRAYTGTGASITQIWDGKDASGVIVPDGVYTYTVDAIHPVTGASVSQASGTITVDNTLPTASITEPTLGATLTGTVAIRGIADDTNFSYPFYPYYSALYYGHGSSPTSWEEISYLFQPVGPQPDLLANWDTARLSNGTYTLKLEVYDKAGNKKITTIPVALYNMNIYDAYASERCFSPNSDGIKDTTIISALITTESSTTTWTLNIKDSSSNIKRTYTATGSSLSQQWDGKDASGAVVPDGIYTYTIDAVDGATGLSMPQVSGEVTVDNTLPTVNITEPVSGATLTGTVAIKGIADDVNFSSAYLYYGQGSSPTQWRRVSYLYQPVGPQSDLLINWNTAGLSNGTYTLRLEVYDSADNEKIVTLPVILYNMNIYNISASPSCFSPNSDGQKDITTITASISTQSATTVWTVNIKDLNGNIKRSYTATGAYLAQAWDGKDTSDAVVPDGVYTYTIDAYDPVTAVSATQASGAITVDVTKPTALITQPTANQLIAGTVEIKGIAKDLNYTGYDGYNYYNYQCYLAYAEEANPNQWYILEYLFSPVPEGPDGSPSSIYFWDTSSLTSGMYILRLLVTDAVGNSSEVLVPVNICNINEYYAAPALFSPNSDGAKDTTSIVAVFSKVANWAISIKDSSGNSVRDFSGQDASIVCVWDGKNASGNVVSDGPYAFTINATDPTTGQSILSGSGNIEVDNTQPTASITQPLPNTQLTGTVTIRGSADDLHYDGSKSVLSWGQGISPTQWNTLADITWPQQSTESVLADWYTDGLKNGPHTLRLLVYDLAGNVKEARVLVNLYNVGILSYYDWPDPFTPDGDGYRDTNAVAAALTMALNWKVTVTDNNTNVIRQFNGSGDSIFQVWDGKNASGQVVVDGVYNYKIEATDPANNISASPAIGAITMDAALPIAIITSPSENATVGSAVTITGTASDNNFTNYKVEYGIGVTPTSWRLISNSTTQVTNATLATWDSISVTNGVYTLRLTVTDVVGHTSTAQKTVTVDNIEITAVSVSPDIINPHLNETTTINYTLDGNADITIKIYDLDNNLKRTLINAVPKLMGANSEVWDGKDDTGAIVPDNAYTITIDAQSGSDRGWYQSSGGFGDNAVGVSNFYFTENFNPYNNELCRIEYTLPEHALFLLQAGQDENFSTYVDIINWEVRPKGNHIEYWDGRDRNGDILDYYNESYPIILGCRTQSLPQNSVVVIGGQRGSASVLSDPYAFMPHFGEFTNISYTIAASGTVSVSICEPSGALIKSLLSNVSKTAGTYILTWDGTTSTGKVVSKDDNYVIKVEFTGADGKTITRYGNITTR